MTADELLHDVGDVLREDEALLDDPRWVRLAAGELDPREAQALRALTIEKTGSDALFQAHEPIDEQARAGLEAMFLPRAEPAVAAGPALREQIRDWLQSWRRLVLVAVPVAAAAVLLVLQVPSHAPLAAYALDPVRGEATLRGMEADPGTGVPTLTATTLLSLTLRPATGVEPPVVVRGFVRGPGGVRAVALPAEVAPGGAVTIDAPAGEVLGGPVGDYELFVVVSRPGAGPDSADEVEAWRDRSEPDAQVLAVPLRFVAP